MKRDGGLPSLERTDGDDCDPGCTDTGSAHTGRTLSTGDMARESCNTLRTVRFYEQQGLLAPRRGCGGRRHFDESQLAKLQLITDFRNAGFSLSDIKTLFSLKARCDAKDGPKLALCDALSTQLECLTEKISHMQRLQSELTTTVAMLGCETCSADDASSRCEACAKKTLDLPPAARLLLTS